ncbi:hypothetical protein [Streptomyces sp. NPDC014734]|uniref:hypothetical protein n=1 Tax=Streptomyces sp. NPDC014734 TaxID=3364886 RepID=UPI0036FA2C63
MRPAPYGPPEHGGWWNRGNSHEYDVVVPAASGGRALLPGSVRWRENNRFGPRDLTRPTGGRAVVPGAAEAALPAVCPAGLSDGVGVDLTPTPRDLPAARRA